MNRADIDKIWLEVKENSKKLKSCNYHDFSIAINPLVPFRRRFKCTRCGGEVSQSDKACYEKGVLHATRKSNGVCWFCGCELIWGGDGDFSDFGYLGEGVVANLSCPGCGATAEFTTKMNDE